MGVGGDIQSDLFMQQAGEVMITAMQSARTRARTKLEEKFGLEYVAYTLEQGLVDVQRYDRETCNLNVALNEIRTLLNLVGPKVPTANDPIIRAQSAPPPAASGGAAGSASDGTVAPTALPMATTIIPPTVQATPEGGIVINPGSVESTPLLGPPPAAATASMAALLPSEQAVVNRAGGFTRFVALLGLDTAQVKTPNRIFRDRVKVIQSCQPSSTVATGMVDQKLLDIVTRSPPNATRRIPGC